MTFATLDHDDGQAVALWLRQNHERPWGKNIARFWGVSISTAKAWLRGQTPARWHLRRMRQHWGPSFDAFISSPEIGSAEDIEAYERLERLEQEIRDLKGILARGRGGLGVVDVRAPHADLGLPQGQGQAVLRPLLPLEEGR